MAPFDDFTTDAFQSWCAKRSACCSPDDYPETILAALEHAYPRYIECFISERFAMLRDQPVTNARWFIEAFAQELSHHGLGLYDVERPGDSDCLVLVPKTEQAEFEALRRRYGGKTQLILQPGKHFGDRADPLCRATCAGGPLPDDDLEQSREMDED